METNYAVAIALFVVAMVLGLLVFAVIPETNTSFPPTTVGSITISSNTYFGYSNGTYFIHPGVYSNISLAENIWFFNNAEYLPSNEELITPLL